MKKISLFVCAVSLATFAIAQETVQNVNELRTPTQRKINFISVEQEQPMTFEPFNAATVAKQKAAAEEFYVSDYYYCEGMMHAGLTADFYGWVPMILLPYQDSIVWKNAVGATTWTVNGREVATDTNSYVTGYGVNGTYYLPQTKEHTFTFTKGETDTTVNVSGYMYGASEPKQFLASAISGGEDNIIMTLCGMYTDTLNGGNDLYRVGAKPYGNYSYGTGLKIAEGKTADTIGVIVRNLAVMKINQINIPVYNASKNSELIIPENGSVKLTIYPTDLSKDSIYSNEEPIAETTMTANDFLDAGSGMGTLVAKFYETNILGDLVETPLVIDGDFYVELTNFNESGCDFGIYSDYYTPGGTTLFTINGQYKTLWSGGGSNLAIGFDAYYPTLFSDTTDNVLSAPLLGGVAAYENGRSDILLYTNADPELGLTIEAPDWVKYEMDTTLFSDYSVVFLTIEAEQYTESGTGREGEVVITADDVVVYTLLIKQGVVTEAIDQTKYLFDNKLYNVLGIEVDEKYQGIVIKNGQKYLQ